MKKKMMLVFMAFVLAGLTFCTSTTMTGCAGKIPSVATYIQTSTITNTPTITHTPTPTNTP